MSESKVHGNMRKGADLALAKKLISQESYRAVLSGEINLQQAKELGRDRGPDTVQGSGGQRMQGQGSDERPEDTLDTPPQPTSRISKNDTLSPCLCDCGELVARRFKPGHDMRLHTYAKEYLRGERELTPEQLSYVRDETDKLERARQQLEKEEARRQERIARKTGAQRQREGEAEAKKRNAK